MVKHVSYRKLKTINPELLSCDIRKSNITKCDDLEHLVDSYNSTLTEIIDNHAPVIKKKIIIRPNTNWYNSNLRQAKVIRRRLERRFLKSNLESDRQAFKTQSALVNYLCNEAKSAFFSQRVLECGRDQKRLFNVTKDILGWSKTSRYPSNIQEQSLPVVFGQYFIDKIIKIRGDISLEETEGVFNEIASNVLPDSVYITEELTSFTPTTNSEIESLIRKSPGTTCGLDPIPTDLLKQCLPELLPVLTKIVNLSLQNADVPSSLKRAVVTPLLKKATLDPNILKNYRPISNLSFISKLTERLVAKRINEYLQTHSLLNKFQSAYRMFHSTESALLRVQSDILDALHNKRMVALVMLDLSSAFDTIDHSILFLRLESSFGIKDRALKWIKSYLHNRSQSVLINGNMSPDISLSFGVPQGSVLGPLLFTMYVTPLADIANKFGLLHHFYADDSQLYVSFDPRAVPTRAIATLERCIYSVKRWMKLNMLKLNDEKTELIIFGSNFNLCKVPQIALKINNLEIRSCDLIKNLGAFFDSKMSMSRFVSDRVKTSMYFLKNISRIRRFLTPMATKTLIHAYVISRLDYSNSLLCGINRSLLRRLQVIQNTAARLVFRKSKFDKAFPLLQTLHWLPIEQRIEFKILVFTHNCLYGKAPDYLSELISWRSSARNLRSSDSFCLTQTKTLNRYGDRAFPYHAPRLWNSLPLDIRSITSLVCFKKAVKTYLFKKAYFS